MVEFEFDEYKAEGNSYTFAIHGTRPIRVIVPKTAVVNIQGKKVVIKDEYAESNPWIRDVIPEIAGRNPVVPQAREGYAETVIPVLTIKMDGIRRVFLGYRVAYEKGEYKVLDAGMYVRPEPPELKGKEAVIPAVKLKGLDDLTQEERSDLASATPPEIIEPLYSLDSRLASEAAAETLKRDPASFARLNPSLLDRMISEAEDVFRRALEETTPAVIEMLITELKLKALTVADKLTMLYGRLAEERAEDKQVKRMKSGPMTPSDFERRIREEQVRMRVREFMREYREVLREVIGLELPIKIHITPAPPHREPERRRQEKGTVYRKQKVSEKVGV